MSCRHVFYKVLGGEYYLKVRKNFRKRKCIAWVMVKTKGEVNIMSYIYIYIYMCVCVCVCMYVYMQETKREQYQTRTGSRNTKPDTHKMKQED
jgi:hypothetical protein